MNIYEFIESLDASCFEDLTKDSIYRKDKLFKIWKDSCKKTKNTNKIGLAYLKSKNVINKKGNIVKDRIVEIVYFDKITYKKID